MKYEVNAVVTPTHVITKRTTYCFNIKSVMELVNKCTTIDEVQKLLRPVEEVINKTIRRRFQFSINYDVDEATPKIWYNTAGEYITNEYRDGLLYLTVLYNDRIDCVTVQVKEVEDSTSDSSDTNKSEE